MKRNNKIRVKQLLFGLSIMMLSGCNDFLDQEPLSDISPVSFLYTENHLEAYVNNYYDILPSLGDGMYGPYCDDMATDNNQGTNNRYLKDILKMLGLFLNLEEIGNLRIYMH